jgi:hypothetical protein
MAAPERTSTRSAGLGEYRVSKFTLTISLPEDSVGKAVTDAASFVNSPHERGSLLKRAAAYRYLS